jgi:serine/alanine adding enzyme
MKIDLCQNGLSWDDYVASRPDAYNQHRWIWRDVIQKTFGHKPFYLIATEREQVRGILPMFSINSRLFGRSMVSVPFFSYGGILANDDVVRAALLQEAIKIAGEIKANHIELRQGDQISCGVDLHDRAEKVTMEVLLPATPDALWARISTGLRNKIRKGQKSELRVEWSGHEGIDAFYPVFAVNMRNLGTPVYPKRWFEAISEALPGQIRIMTLYDEDIAVASAFLMPYRDRLELPWSASIQESRKKYSHVLMYWLFLEYAIQQGFRRMDLGRCTPGGGTYEFKRHWGCEEKPLHWYHWAAPGTPVPELNPENKKFQMAIEIWKRLPLPVANFVGPRIVKALP